MDLLHGWKEIADYLHLTVRTAQRWERLGLPVRRVSNSASSRIVAIPDELGRWARQAQLAKDGYADMSTSMLTTKLFELRSIQKKARRRTRRLTRQVHSLRMENNRLMRQICSSLASNIHLGT